MPPMSPPPPPPMPPLRPTVVFTELQAQSVSRKMRLANHKATVMEFSAHVEDHAPEAVPLPSKEELNDLVNQDETNRFQQVASQVLDHEESGDEIDSIADGFAALRAQSAQRKAKLRKLKRTTAQCSHVKARTKAMPKGARLLRDEIEADDGHHCNEQH